MKLTKKQQADLDSLLWFAGDNTFYSKPTNEDITSFFDYSERGINPKEITKGYETLLLGKKRRDEHVGIYEEGVLGGSVPYFVLLGGFCGKKRNWFLRLLGFDRFRHNPMPRSVVNFMKKNMFQGIDAENIEKVYQEIIT